MKTFPPKLFSLLCSVVLCTNLSAQEPHMADGNTQLLYHLNEPTGTATVDSSGHLRNGTFGAGLVINSAGLPFFQKSVQPGSGLTNRMQWTHTGAGTGSFLYPSTGADFTIEGWFKIGSTSFTNNRTLFAVQPNGAATIDYQLNVMASTDATRPLGLVFRDGPAFRCYTAALSWNTSTWYHIAVVVKHNGSTVDYSIYRTPQGSAAPVLVASRTTVPLVPAAGAADRVFSVGNFYGNWGADFFPGLIDDVRYSDIARSPGDLKMTVKPDSYDRIRREAFAPNNQKENPLPLFSGWSNGMYSYLYNKPDDFGYSPVWQLAQIANGRHLLPWFATPDPAINSTSPHWSKYLRYYENPIKEVALHDLPISFTGTQWEQYLFSDPIYTGLTDPVENPNVPYTDEIGNPQRAISPFSKVSQWAEIGNRWGTSSLMQLVQGWYPNPPFVIFLSNNEAPRLKYQYLSQDPHYVDRAIASTQTDEYKRGVVGEALIQRYRTMQNSWRTALSTPWENNCIFIGYGAFGPSFFGRVYHWPSGTLTIPNRLSPWPLAWDGGSADNYLNGTANADHQVFGPQTEAMNYELMRREAMAQNPSFWFEISTWNGGDYSAPWTGQEDQISKNKLCRFNPMRVPLPAEGQPDTLVQPVPNAYVPIRYGAMVQFSMWILRPRVIRDYRIWSSARADTDGVLPYLGSSQPYTDALMNAVDKIYSNEVLQTFWRDSELVVNPTRLHPYQEMIPDEYKEATHPVTAARMYQLKTNVEPTGTWSLYTQISVFAMARVRGTAPNREWLIYVHAPIEVPVGATKSALVTIPGFRDVAVTATLGGRFYLAKESTNQTYLVE